jgi:hypothetical protein
MAANSSCGDDWVRFDHNVITYTITREDGGPTTFTTAKTPDNGSPQGVEESF